MKVSKLEIKNFRLLQNITIDFEDYLSIIIGKNNCGKTSILSILKKCIAYDKKEKQFEYFDFSISFQKKLSEYVINEKDLKLDKEDNEDNGIIMYMYIEYDENDNLNNLKEVILDLDDQIKTAIIKFEYTISENQFNNLKKHFNEYKIEKQLNKSNNDSQQIKDNDNNDKKLFLKFITKRYANYFEFKQSAILANNDGEPIEEVSRKIENINKIINFKYIDAKRDVSNINKKQLSSLTNEYYKKLNKNDHTKAHLNTLENNIDQTDDMLTKVYKDIFEPLINKISKFGGRNQNETFLNIMSNIESENLLNSNTTVVYSDDTNQENNLPEHYNGLGYLNLISIIIKIETLLSDFRKDTKPNEDPADINLLFIEEPEAHAHPQMQYIFIKNIKDILEEGKKFKKGETEYSINLQTLMTTHSSHIVSECNFDDIKYLFKEHNKIEVKNLKSLKIGYTHKDKKETNDKDSYFKFLKQNLNLGMAEIFFADKVILVEGETERILLPAMMKKIDKENENLGKETLPLLSQNISIITVGNYAQKYANFLNFIGIKTLIITDFDTYKKEKKLDKDGNVEKNEDGEDKTKEVKCRVREATHIGNNLRKFFKDQIKENNSKNEKEILQRLEIKDKIFRIDTETENFIKDEDGKICVVYQTEENAYNARSFEDAFIHINRNFIKNNKDDFLSLKNETYFNDNKYDSYDLAEKCIDKKPSFAMDILINSKGDFSNWDIPAYIKEGLEWIQQD